MRISNRTKRARVKRTETLPISFWIGDEVVGEGEFVFEGLLRFGLVKADAEDLHAVLAQIGKGIAQGACLFRAARSVGLRIEEDDRGAFLVNVGKVDGGSVLIDAGDGGGVVTDLFTFAGIGDAEQSIEESGEHEKA